MQAMITGSNIVGDKPVGYSLPTVTDAVAAGV